MNLEQLLKEEIRSYIEGRSTLAALREWLADHAQALVDAATPELDALEGRTWILLSEHDYGHRDEASIRTELSGLLEGSPRFESAPEAGDDSAFVTSGAVTVETTCELLPGTDWLTSSDSSTGPSVHKPLAGAPS